MTPEARSDDTDTRLSDDTEAQLDDCHLQEASRLVDDERDYIEDALAAYDRFLSGVGQLAVDTPTAAGGSATGGPQSVSTAVRGDSTGSDGLQELRSLFADTVYPCSTAEFDEPEPLLVTVREELGAEIAFAVSPSTDCLLTPDLKGAIETAADQSRMELRAMDRGLDREAESLRTARSLHDEIVDCQRADHPPLSALGFEALSERHERLDEFRRRCEQLAADRQSTIHEVTNHTISADLSHDLLVEYLYQPLPVEYPVLSAVVRLIDFCEHRQRTLRASLTACS